MARALLILQISVAWVGLAWGQPTPGRTMLRLWHAERRGGGRLSPATLTRIKGQVYGQHPELFRRQVQLSKKRRQEHLDPSFKGTHPMFQRLARSGWYGQQEKIGALQSLANKLRATRGISGRKPLSQVEFLAFDLEATCNNSGSYNRKRGRFYSGWDEVTQLGYTIYRGGRKVGSGSIEIRPDVAIAPKVQELTGLTAQKLGHAPRFEQVASRILQLMQGRVMIGQGATKRDWAWLQSNFARLGVRLPGPRGLVLDTHLLSFNQNPRGDSLRDLAQKLRVPQRSHHDARYDAEAAGDVFFAMMRRGGVSTLGQAFAQQARGDRIRHSPRPQ